MRYRSTTGAALATAALLLSLGGCGHLAPGGRSDPSVAPTTVGPTATLQLGVLTGPRSAGQINQAVLSGARLAVSQYDSGDTSALVATDMVSAGSTPASAGKAVATLIADHVAAVVGPPDGATAVEVAGPLSRAGIPFLPISVPAGETGFATNAYTTTAGNDDLGQAATNQLQRLGAGVLGVVQGQLAGDRAQAQAALSAAVNDGLQLGGEWSLEGAEDIPDLASKIVGSSTNGLYYSGPADQAVSLVLDLSADHYSGSVVLSTPEVGAQVLGDLGSDGSGVYVLSAADDPADDTTPESLVFSDSYRAAFGHLPPTWAAEAYDATEMVQAAVKAGARNGAGVAAWLSSHTFQGVTGSLSFDGGTTLNPPLTYFTAVSKGKVTQLPAASGSSSS